MSSSHRETNFSSQRTAIPFGKFEAGSDDVFPCNESMVGREGARAKLIDFLTNAGTRKALLVTGRRGMGKTSFVSYCIDEYVEARIERYWRSDIGRTVGAWIWILAISLLCSAAFVSSCWLLKILLDNAINQQNYFLWIPLVPLVFCLSYPLIHAIKIFTTLFKIIPTIPINFLGYLCVLMIILVFLHIPDSGSPIITLSGLLVIATSIYFAGEWLDNYFVNLITYNNKRAGWLALSILGTFFGFLTFWFDPIAFQNNPTENGASRFISNLFVASEFLGLAAINRGLSLCQKPLGHLY